MGASSLAILVAAAPQTAAAATPPPVTPAPDCVNTLQVPLPAQTSWAWDVQVRNGTVLLGREVGWTSSPPVHLQVFDLASATFAALTPATPGVAEWGATFVDDSFIAYQRIDANLAISEMRAHWIGADGVWATADDVDWAFDSAPNVVPSHGAFSDPYGNEGELAYVRYVLGADELRTCNFFLGSTHECLPGSVTSVVQSSPATFAHPVGNGATLIDRFYPQTDWLDFMGTPTPWIAERVFDVWGPFVLSDAASLVSPLARLHVSLAVDPAQPPLWTVPTNTPGWAARISRIPGSNGHLRIAWREPNDVGAVADLGTAVGIAHLTGRALSIGPYGDEVAYTTIAGTGWWPLELAVDDCVF